MHCLRHLFRALYHYLGRYRHGKRDYLTPVRYYPEDGTSLYLRGYYPPVPMAADGTLTFTLTGDEDLLLSGEQNGSLSSPFTSDSKGTLIYNHLLTKLSFAIHLEGDDIPSLRVRSLQLNGLAGQVTLALQTGALSYGDATVPVPIYSAAADAEGLPFTGGVLQLPGYALVQPQSDFTLDMVIAVDDDRSHDLEYHDLAISFEGGEGEGGIAYTVKVELPTPTFPDPYLSELPLPLYLGKQVIPVAEIFPAGSEVLIVTTI